MNMLIFLLVFLAIGQVHVSGYNYFKDVAEGAKPFQVSLRNHDVVLDEDNHYCSGAILAPKWVVTAGRCLDNKRSHRIRVVVGTNYLGHNGTWYEAEKIIIHPDYSSFQVVNDIGLIKMKTDIEFGKNVGAIKLPDIKPPAGSTCAVSGWGYSDGEGHFGTVLQETNVTTISTEDCQKTEIKKYKFILSITDQQICGNKDGEGQICLGEKGAPLVKDDQLVGLSSLDIPCNVNLPTVYVRVYNYKSWITKNMK